MNDLTSNDTPPAAGDEDGVTNVAKSLLTELRDGQIRPEDKEVLRTELVETDNAANAQLPELQRQVSGFAEYTHALETFLDTWGPADDLLDDLRDEVAGVREDVTTDLDNARGEVANEIDSLRTEIATVNTLIEDDEHRLDAAEDKIDTLNEDLDLIETEIDGLHEELSRIPALADRAETLETNLATVSSTLQDMAEFRDQLTTAMGAINRQTGEGK